MSTGVKEYINPKAKFYKMDICDDNISQVFKENRIDVINHHAAQIDLKEIC